MMLSSFKSLIKRITNLLYLKAMGVSVADQNPLGILPDPLINFDTDPV